MNQNLIAHVLATLCGVMLLASCRSAPPTNVPQQDATVQGHSLLGGPLIAPELAAETKAARERDLEIAQGEYDRDPHDEQAIIWLGRRLAYLGCYSDAIDIFSNGLAIHPESYKLLRHRGHRYITLRKFDLARADLSRAAALIESRRIADETEADGQPNKLGIPTSTSHTNIYYHLGLVQYLQGDFSAAVDSYRRCMEFSKNDDMRVATAYWLYLALRRSGDDNGAAKVLAAISREMNIIENTSYHQLLLKFKGDVDMPTAGDSTTDLTIDDATIGYGLALYAMLQEDYETSRRWLERVVNNTNWAAFGHIAAEVEVDKALRGIVK